MDKDLQIVDIVSTLDNFVNQGVGHMNIEVDKSADSGLSKSVEQLDCLDCAKGNLACQVPTFFDNNETENE